MIDTYEIISTIESELSTHHENGYIIEGIKLSNEYINVLIEESDSGEAPAKLLGYNIQVDQAVEGYELQLQNMLN